MLVQLLVCFDNCGPFVIADWFQQYRVGIIVVDDHDKVLAACSRRARELSSLVGVDFTRRLVQAVDKHVTMLSFLVVGGKGIIVSGRWRVGGCGIWTGADRTRFAGGS